MDSVEEVEVHVLLLLLFLLGLGLGLGRGGRGRCRAATAADPSDGRQLVLALCNQLSGVLALDSGEELCESVIVDGGIDRTKDVLDVGLGAFLAGKVGQKVSGNVLHS